MREAMTESARLRELVLVVWEARGRGLRRGSRTPLRDASRAIAEHSMCQPGRPEPHGDSHARVLVRLLRLPEGEVTLIPLEGARLLRDSSRRAARPRDDRTPEPSATLKYTSPPASYARPRSISSPMIAIDLGDRLGRSSARCPVVRARARSCPRSTTRVASLGELAAPDSLARRLRVDLVVDVGDVVHESRLVAVSHAASSAATSRGRTGATLPT